MAHVFPFPFLPLCPFSVLFLSFFFFSPLFLRFFLSFLPSSFLSFPVSFLSPFLSFYLSIGICLSSSWSFLLVLSLFLSWETLAFFGVVKQATRHVGSKGVLTLGFRKESEERPSHKSVPSQQLHSQFSIWMVHGLTP
jgi:predicted PurR-regulated permease PerM